MKKFEANVLEATEKSIKKWEGILFEGKKDNGVNDCALCELFNKLGNDCEYDDCVECPIYKLTGKVYCENTPYIEYCRMRSNNDSFQALKMLKFLTDKLLPFVKENMVDTCHRCKQEVNNED